MARITSATNTLSSPAWAGDFLNREHLVPGGAKLLASAFLAEDAVVVTLSGNEAIGQTDIGVTALSGPIPSGAILKSGAGEFMQLTAAAAAGRRRAPDGPVVAECPGGVGSLDRGGPCEPP